MPRRAILSDSHPRFALLLDWLVIAIAFSLPLSTSATAILIPIWLLLRVMKLDWRALLATVQSPPGGLPVVLFLVGAVGMLWADVPMRERFDGLIPFARLLVIPFLIVQFQESRRGDQVLAAFAAGCIVVLIASYAIAAWPKLMPARQFGVPFKNYITQSFEFTVCAFALAHLAFEQFRKKQMWQSGVLAGLSALFFLDIFFITTSRTTLVVIPVVLLFWAARTFGLRGVIVASVAGLVAAIVLWEVSPYVRSKVLTTFIEAQSYEKKENAETSTGYRIEFVTKAIGFVASAPVLGHGTGSIRQLYANVASSGMVPSTVPATNPHNQTLTVAVQVGAIGVIMLWAMWIAHLLQFKGRDVWSWFGLFLCLPHVIGSAFNSYLFDFTEGWIYILGVGVLLGTVRLNETLKPAVRRRAT